MKKLSLLFLALFFMIGCSNLEKNVPLKTGTFKTFYENGNCKKIKNYTDGLLDGEFIEFFENLNIKTKVNYKNGKKDGIFQNFYEDGDLKETGLYKDGLKFGIWTYFNKDKSINFKTDFKNKGYFNPEILNNSKEKIPSD